MGKNDSAMERYENMDAEERKYEARRRVTRMVVMRLILAGLLVWVMVTNKLPVGMIALLVVVILVIIGSMVPVFQALKTDLQYEDE